MAPSSDAAMERLASLQKRLRRSLAPTASSSNARPADQARRPPDEASSALGLQLGLAFGDAVLTCASTLDDTAGTAAARSRSTDRSDVETLRKTGFDIVDALSGAARSSSPSVSFGFCQGVIDAFASSDAKSKPALLIVLPWWSLWLGQCDETISNALLRGYAGCTYRLAVLKHLDVAAKSDTEDSTTCLLADAYSALESDADRRCLVRECIGVAFANMMHGYNGDEGSRLARMTITYLSELVAPCVLLSIGTPLGGVNCTLFWTAIIREFHLFVLSMPHKYCEDAIALIIPWLTHILHLATLRMPRQGRHDTITGTDEIFSMLLQLCEVICHISLTVDLTGERSLASTMGTVYNMVLGDILCHFLGLGYSLGPVVSQLCNSLCRESTGSTKALELSDATIFRLGLLALNEPDEKEAHRILQALSRVVERGLFVCSCGHLIVGTVRALGCIYASSPVCNAVATKLQELANKNEHHLLKTQLRKNSSLDLSVDHIICLFGERSKIVTMSELVAPTTCNGAPWASPDEQACELLLASSLLNANANISGIESFSFLRRVVEQWSHVAIRALPLATASVQASAACGDSDRAISALHFLCSATAKDPICAQTVWNIVSKFTAPTSPSVVRAACIRLFVPLCKSNKKLYGRVRDTLGPAVASAETAIRIAAVATLCDLAKADLIRDVSEVIGWLQNALGDGEGTVVHYAVMSLHYFIQEGELDFSKVIKVMSKTLVAVDNISAILSLPPTVMEALVILFGDGAVGAEEDGEDSTDDDDSTISPQVEAAVRALFDLATTMSKHISSVADVSKEHHLRVMREDADRILQAIYTSMSMYKIEELGFDSDTVRSVVLVDRSPTGLREETSDLEDEQNGRYRLLQRIVMDGLVQRIQATSEHPETDQKLIQLAWNLLSFEEDALGPSLWMKPARSTSSASEEKKNPQKLSKLLLKALPDSALLESQYKENPCTATAIARMYCLETASSPSATPPDDLMELLAEVSCDVKNDSSDPLFRALSAGAWIESMNSVWLSIVNFSNEFSSDEVTRVVQELCEWKHCTDQHDNALVALGAFVFAIPDRYQGTDLSNIADEIGNNILDIYDGHEFAEPDAAAFSLGFMGKRYARSMNLALVRGIIGRLDEIHSFNGCYGLAMIAQVFSSSLDSISKADLSRKAACTIVGTIASMLMSKLHSCMRKPSPHVLNLIACLKMGSGDSDLIKSMIQVPETDLIVEENLRLQMKGILISLAVTVPALRHLDNDLVAASCSLIAKCPWGVGKGYVLASAYKLQSNLCLEEMKGVYSECVDAVAGTESGAPYDDALFAAIAFDKFLPQDEKRADELMPLIRRVLDGNKVTPDVRASATLAICAYFGSVPLISENSSLYASTKKSSLETAVTNLMDMIHDTNESRRCTDMAAVALGIFCRMKVPRKGVVFTPYKNAVAKGVDPHSSDLPLARDSTLLRKLLDSIRSGLTGVNDSEIDQRVVTPLLISCIRRIPLPGDFSVVAKKSFNQNNCEKTINAAFLRLLIAQIESERHSGSNRSEFISLSIYVAKRPAGEFWSLFESTGGAVNQFMAATSLFLLTWPSGVIDELLTNLWSISCFEISNRKSFQSAKALLLSIAATLQRYNVEDQGTAMSRKRKKSGGQLSPVALKSVRRLLIVEVFPSLVHVMPKVTSTRYDDPNTNDNEKEETQPSIWASYFSCLEHIPLTALHDDGFLPVGKQSEDVDTTVTKIYCIAHLAGSKQGDSLGTARDLLKANLWIARQKASSLTVEQLKAIRVSMFHLASSRSDPNSTPTDCARDLILQSLESMLVNGLDSLALEQLAVQCGYLCGCASVGPSMSRLITKGKIQSCGAESFSPDIVTNIMSLFVRDLPSRLGSISTTLAVSSLVANRCLRVLKQVECDGIPSNYELYDAAVNALKQITTCCSEIESNSMQYTKFIISEMRPR